MSTDECGPAALKQPPAQNAGSATYTPFALRLYDLIVLRISNSYAWKCSTKKVQLPLFQATLGNKHLDVGVGTGYYPANAVKVETHCREITLVDLNPNTLDLAAARITALRTNIKVRSVIADVTESLPLPLGQKFDSVSIFYLLHCLAGPPEGKTKIFSLLKDYVADDGVLVGTTILGEERSMNWLARRLMKLYNGKGIFDNWKDGRSVFEDGLRQNFDEVDIQIIGRSMVFTARKPKKDT
ncbi:S-adenosyl-L-methionine-dependent methyltransferase [Trichoderma ceciliae]